MAGQQGTAPLGQPTQSGTTLAPPSTAATDANTLSQMAASREMSSVADQQQLQNKIAGMAGSTPPLTSGSPQSGKAPGSDPAQATAPNPSTGKAPGETSGGASSTPYQQKMTTGNVYLPQTTAQETAANLNNKPSNSEYSPLMGPGGSPLQSFDYGI